MAKKHLDKDTKLSVAKLYEEGVNIQELSSSFNVSEMTIYRWVKKYRQGVSFDKKEFDGRGRPPKIDNVDAISILEALKIPASQFGFETDLWTTTRMRQLCKNELNIDISRMGIWRLFTKLNQSFKKVKKEYYEASKNKQTRWKKDVVPKIKKLIKEKRAILYFQDECSLQISPVMGKSWGDIGSKVTHKGTSHRGSIAAIWAISNRGNLIFNLFDKGKRFNADDIISFLNEMLKHHPKRHLVIVMDRATCHTSKKVLDYMDLKIHRPSGRVTRNQGKEK